MYLGGGQATALSTGPALPWHILLPLGPPQAQGSWHGGLGEGPEMGQQGVSPPLGLYEKRTQ